MIGKAFIPPKEWVDKVSKDWLDQMTYKDKVNENAYPLELHKKTVEK